jgi:hypothetical protein
MLKEKKYVLAGYQERRYNFYTESWGSWYECSLNQFNYAIFNPRNDDTQVREIYALED